MDCMETLQDLCLNVVIEEFDRYYAAYNTTEDANLKRKFEFLQRVYSFEILIRFNQEYKMDEKYIDLLINKYLKILDSDWFLKCPWKTVIAKVAEVGPNIKKIYLHEVCTKERPWQEIFCHLQNLEELHFQRNCTDEILSNITKFCPNIIEIDIRSSFNISEDGLKCLCEKRNGKFCCPKLKTLLLKQCELTETVAKLLVRNLPSLEDFDYQDLPLMLYAMHKQDLPELGKIQPYNLSKLNFSHASNLPYFNDILKICISVCPYLTTLTCHVLDPQYLDLFCGLSHLEILHLECGDKEKFNVNNFLKLTKSKLTSLQLDNCSLSLLTLSRSCTSLKQFFINNIKFEDHAGAIPLFHNLESFTVICTEFSDSANNLKSVCLILSSSPKLENIDFKQSNLSSSEIKTGILKCCEHCPIQKLEFNSSIVGKQFIMDILLTCHSLKSFILYNCELNSDDEDEIYTCAETLPNKPDIDFSNQLSDTDFDDLFDDYNNDFDFDFDNDLDDDYCDDDDDDDLPPYDDDDEEEDYDGIYGYFF